MKKILWVYINSAQYKNYKKLLHEMKKLTCNAS